MNAKLELDNFGKCYKTFRLAAQAANVLKLLDPMYCPGLKCKTYGIAIGAEKFWEKPLKRKKEYFAPLSTAEIKGLRDMNRDTFRKPANLKPEQRRFLDSRYYLLTFKKHAELAQQMYVDQVKKLKFAKNPESYGVSWEQFYAAKEYYHLCKERMHKHIEFQYDFDKAS